MINFDDITKENTKKHNPNWLQTPYSPYKIVNISRSGSGKTGALLDLINSEPDIDQIYS